MNQILQCDWLHEWATCMVSSCLLGITHCVPQENSGCFPLRQTDWSKTKKIEPVQNILYWFKKFCTGSKILYWFKNFELVQKKLYQRQKLNYNICMPKYLCLCYGHPHHQDAYMCSLGFLHKLTCTCMF